MKKNTLLAAAFCAAALLTPTAVLLLRAAPAALPSPAAAPSQAPSPAAASAQVPSPTAASAQYIELLSAGRRLTLELNAYLVGAVAAEMPASFEPEALKAQAVAARSYAVWRCAHSPHGEGCVCDESGCCCAWADETRLRALWGADYANNLSRISAAVEATDGVYLTFGGEAIAAAFHSSSLGSTAAGTEVWENAAPYLQAVSTPESADTVRGLLSEYRISADELQALLLRAFPDAELPADPRLWLSHVLYSPSGRVASLRVGGVETTGNEFRLLLALRSAAFDLTFEDGVFVFSCAGYGHGAGMSQYGANLLAKSGLTYEAILRHYYTGVEISSPG